MSQTAVSPDAYEHLGIETRKLGMWVFLASETMFFTGLIGAYIVIRSAAPNWPDPSTVLNIPLTAFNTFVLVVSSATLVKGLISAQEGNREGMQVGLFLTVLLGTLFLSVQASEYRALMHEENFRPSSGIFGSCFYAMTGFHGLHVLIGVICMFFVFIRSMMGYYTPQEYRGIEVLGLYWHFVDLVWIILFTIVYLL